MSSSLRCAFTTVFVDLLYILYVVYFRRVPKKCCFSSHCFWGQKWHLQVIREAICVALCLHSCHWDVCDNFEWWTVFEAERNLWLDSFLLHSAEDPLSTSSPIWLLTCPNGSTMLTTFVLIKSIFWWIDSGWLWGNIICVVVRLFLSSHSHPFNFLHPILIPLISFTDASFPVLL